MKGPESDINKEKIPAPKFKEGDLVIKKDQSPTQVFEKILVEFNEASLLKLDKVKSRIPWRFRFEIGSDLVIATCEENALRVWELLLEEFGKLSEIDLDKLKPKFEGDSAYEFLVRNFTKAGNFKLGREKMKYKVGSNKEYDSGEKDWWYRVTGEFEGGSRKTVLWENEMELAEQK
jgi:hypothetical protein